jgi:hypothetical protein
MIVCHNILSLYHQFSMVFLLLCTMCRYMRELKGLIYIIIYNLFDFFKCFYIICRNTGNNHFFQGNSIVICCNHVFIQNTILSAGYFVSSFAVKKKTTSVLSLSSKTHVKCYSNIVFQCKSPYTLKQQVSSVVWRSSKVAPYFTSVFFYIFWSFGIIESSTIN